MIRIGGAVFELEGDGLRIESDDDCIVLTGEETLKLIELASKELKKYKEALTKIVNETTLFNAHTIATEVLGS